METKERGSVHEWRIENLSHWCAEVHGHCIRSPYFGYPCPYMELYPKGMDGQGEHLVVTLICNTYCTYSGELSFHSSDGFLMCNKQQVNSVRNPVLVLPPGPKFEDVLSRIREGEDFITLKLLIKDRRSYKECVCSTINVLKISLGINPRWIEEMRKSSETKEICYIYFSPDNSTDRMELTICSKNDRAHFSIKPPTQYEFPFAIEMRMLFIRSDGTVDNSLKKKHVFRDDSPWTFPDPQQKRELLGKEISLFLWLTTKNLIQCPHYVNWYPRYVSIKINPTPCLSVKEPSTGPVTSDKVEVVTKDSGIQTSLTSNIPDDSVLVLSKELMCLYQDQKFSDITLKCDNVTFPVHRNILSARSPVFDRLLSSDMAEASSGEVDIGDLDPSTLSRFLTHLYTGTAEEELLEDSALKLYYAADKYQVPSLKRDCSKFLCANVSLSNVCDILSLADRHQDVQLTAASHDFILENYNCVLKSKEWEGFMSREPLLAVKTVTQFAAKDSVVRKHPPK